MTNGGDNERPSQQAGAKDTQTTDQIAPQAPAQRITHSAAEHDDYRKRYEQAAKKWSLREMWLAFLGAGPKAMLEGFIFILAVAGAIIVGYQAWQGKEQLILTKNAAKDADETTRRQERAWLGLETLQANFEVGKQPLATLVYINAGKTPARNVRTAIAIRPFPSNQDCKAPDPLFPEKGASSSVLMPGVRSQAQKHWQNVMTAEMMNDIAAGRVQMCIHSYITYEDIFGRQGMTSLCHQLLPDGRVTSCGHGNDAK